MSQTKATRRDFDRAQAELLIARGLASADAVELANALLQPGGNQDLCARLMSQGRLSFEQARLIRGEALAYLGVSELEGSSFLFSSTGDSSLADSYLDPPSGPTGGRLEGYEILDKVGQGAMGSVARARHLESGRMVALKTILADGPDDDELRRFQREARALILLKHPCLVEVFDVSMSERAVFLAMELIDGQDLRANVEDVMRREGAPPSWEQVDWVFRDLADALAYCHSQGVIHRDVKPQNIVLDADRDRAVLIDFGLIKHDEEGPGSSRSVALTFEGATVGTPAFMSPEQLFPGGDYGPLTAAADVWGFGATLFYTLTGRAPYDGSSTVEIAMRMREGPAPDLRELCPETPARVAELCAACLDHDADRRPTAAALFASLDADGGGAHRKLWLAAALAALALLAAFAFMAMAPKTERALPPPASKEATRPLLSDGLELTLRDDLGPIVIARSEGAGALSVVAEVSGGPEHFRMRLDGRILEVRGGRVRLPVDPAARRFLAPRALKGGVWERTEKILWRDEDREAARRILDHQAAWAEAEPHLRAEVAALVAFRLGTGYEALELKLYKCGGQAFEVARYRHTRTGIVFHLIPGGSVKLQCFADPDDDYVRGLLAVQAIPRARRKLADYRSDNIAERAAAFFAERFQQVVNGLGLSRAELGKLRRYILSEEGWRDLTEDEMLPLLDRFYAALSRDLTAAYTAEDTRVVPGFLMAATETSEAQWAELTRAEERRNSALPVTGIPYGELRAKVEAAGFRLPLREQWLHALAGGTAGHYFWGEDSERLADYVWFSANSPRLEGESERLHAVTEHAGAENAFGLADMLGNAMEWGVEDWPAWVRCLRQKGIQDINVDGEGRRLRLVAGDRYRGPPRTRGPRDRPSTREGRGARAEEKPAADPGRDGVVRQPVLGLSVGYKALSLRSLRYYFRKIDRGEKRRDSLRYYGCRLARDLPKLGF